MDHFVQYHNSDIMGQFQPSEGDDFWIVTNKSAPPRGSTVWLVVGRGRPRRYFLCETFVVKGVSRRAGKFRYKVSGSWGRGVAPPENEVGDAAWFPRLRQLTGNFRYGLQPITDQGIVDAFRRYFPD